MYIICGTLLNIAFENGILIVVPTLIIINIGINLDVQKDIFKRKRKNHIIRFNVLYVMCDAMYLKN